MPIPPPTRGKTIRRRKKAGHADRLEAGFAGKKVAPATPQSPSSAGPTDRGSSSIKVELALLRAFLGDEIDAILRHKD
jgi:hypothetical protein